MTNRKSWWNPSEFEYTAKKKERRWPQVARWHDLQAFPNFVHQRTKLRWSVAHMRQLVDCNWCEHCSGSDWLLKPSRQKDFTPLQMKSVERQDTETNEQVAGASRSSIKIYIYSRTMERIVSRRLCPWWPLVLRGCSGCFECRNSALNVKFAKKEETCWYANMFLLRVTILPRPFCHVGLEPFALQPKESLCL